MFNNKYGFKLGCNVTQWVGDGYCDDVSNTIECNYDGGDCCLDNTNTVYCTDCLCFDGGRYEYRSIFIYVCICKLTRNFLFN